MDKEKDQKLEPVRTPPKIKPVLSTSWRHPDPRCERVIQQCCILGYPKSRIAEIMSMDVRDLEYYYSDVMVYGRAYLGTQLLERAAEEALNGDVKMLKYLLDRVWDKDASKAQEEIESAAQVDGLHFKNLTVKELKELRRLMNKAKEPLDGKVE